MKPSLLKYFVVLLLAGFLLGMSRPASQSDQQPLPRLSAYGFFEGPLAAQRPAKGVVPYDLRSPLFTDYASKLRFVVVPEGKQVRYHGQEVLDFPAGTTIIKTFFYPHDARKPEKGRRLLETRLLIREESGWKALSYHWNEEQTDAVLELAGASTEVRWTDESGKKWKFQYLMPNVNQCKGCHSWDGAMRPIGPSARQLNGSLQQGGPTQLRQWADAGFLHGLPEDHAAIPTIAKWDQPETGSLDARARAWLDINCGHCHNPHGPASTSGLFLDIHQTDPAVIGVNKPPVAAGRGSGNLDYDIVPGHPDKSILYYRVNSADPGIMMPEVGRVLIHEEAVDLIRAWIQEMEG